MANLRHHQLLLFGSLSVVVVSIIRATLSQSVLAIGNIPKINDEMELDLTENYWLKHPEVFILFGVRIDSNYT